MSIFKSFCIGSKDGKQRWVLLTTKELVRRDSVLTLGKMLYYVIVKAIIF